MIDSPIQLLAKPRDRGRFSRERHVWDLIHRDRFNRWIEGQTIEDIAEAHGVTRQYPEYDPGFTHKIEKKH